MLLHIHHYLQPPRAPINSMLKRMDADAFLTSRQSVDGQAVMQNVVG